MPPGTVRLHRVLHATPERVYRTFLDADAMAKWIPPYGFTCKVAHGEFAYAHFGLEESECNDRQR